MRQRAARRHRHLQLDQAKLTRAKAVLGAKTETEAIERALALVVEEHRLDQLLKWVKGRMQLRRVFRRDAAPQSSYEPLRRLVAH